MKFSVITPVFNCKRFLAESLDSVARQRETAPEGIEIEHIVVDGGSTDGSLELIGSRRKGIDIMVSEPDGGPADAINKGLRLASGDYLAWLNADDLYAPDAIARFADAIAKHPGSALYFGHCAIIDENGAEIRSAITHFKNAFFPFSCRALIQSINYLSQPASVFSRAALEKAGPLRTDLKAAFDYDLTLRLWREGGAKAIGGKPLASFRWHPTSISGSSFRRQFKEEFDIARNDAGRFAPQTLAHRFVCIAIVAIYSAMARRYSKQLSIKRTEPQ